MYEGENVNELMRLIGIVVVVLIIAWFSYRLGYEQGMQEKEINMGKSEEHGVDV